MNRLRANYDGRVEFFELDVDNPDSKAMRDRYGMRAQAIYVLADADGGELNRWFGLLPEADLIAAFDGVLG
ncbi:MAG: hypothetical protein OXG07_01975 [Anaerolineaceae bacterium]|nr:hypothetical protein [Anaerolineaceae bacterium]MCY3906315.1 hypothetical protein [Anaerolineaceae bacterium]MDE0609387.1 hypothetical protein [Anaerolineaceae bacterium]